MATLKELAVQYRETAVALHLRLRDARRELREAEGAERAVQARRVRQLEQMLEESRAMRRLCEGYYEEIREGEYTMAFLRAERRERRE